MKKENVKTGTLLLLLLLLAFVIVKWPHLSYPFYWDESWSYAPGVRLMYNHGPSLLPNAIDPFYSRGHPLFFYASAAAWMHGTGGYSHFSAHLFALFVTLCLLIVVYYTALKLGGTAVAVASVVALMLHVGFFVQASFVMPEMQVALFSLLALTAFAARKYGLAGGALTLLLFTKESGVVAGLVLGLAALATLLYPQVSRREKVQALLSVAVPAVLIGAFFLVQKKMLGWYLYPEHTGLISLSGFFGKLRVSLSYLLASEAPKALLYVASGAGVAAALYKRRLQPLLPLFPLGVAFLVGRQKIDFLPSGYQFALLTGTLVAALALYVFKYKAPATKKRWIVLLSVFGYGYLCFCSLNFFTLRYLLAALVPLTIGLVWIAANALAQLHRQAVWAVPVAAAVGGFFMFRNDAGMGDVNLQAYNAMRVQGATVRFLEKQHWFQKTIGTGSFQDAEHLRKPYTGFLSTPRAFSDVNWGIDARTEVAVFNNIEEDKRREAVQADTLFKQVYRVQDGSVWAEIYLRKKMP